MKRNKLVLISAISMVFVLLLAACQTETQEEEPLPTAAPAVSQTPTESPSEEPMESEEPEMSEEPSESEAPMEDKTFTLEELSKFDGLDGRKAYVAVNGVVYDLTDSGAWRNGKHNGFTAGKDLTEEIENVSPHGVIKLEGIPVVGKLADN